MSTIDVVRAWKDPEYLASLSEAERAALPAHPAGPVELSREELGLVAGGGGGLAAGGPVMSTAGTNCTGSTQCTAHSCGAIPNPTIYINPGPLVGGGR
jgi:mersacidin/lichenicidin family type 2 lantibiotic